MKKSELFDLSDPKVGFSKKLDKKLINLLKKKIQQQIKNFDAYLIHNCDFLKNFTGRDIDALYVKKKKKFKTDKDKIIRSFDNNSFRIHLNHNKNNNFISLDIENISDFPESIKDVFKDKFLTKVYCNRSKLHHLNNKGIVFYKLVKYFHLGTIHSYSQLLYLKKDINKLRKNDINLILKTIEETLPIESKIIKKFIFLNFDKFSKDKSITKFFFNKRKNRHKKRKIFSGKLNLKNLIRSKYFIYSLLIGSRSNWSYSHNPMPAISIIGNDGSGKSSAVEYIRKNFSKMDPLIFDMKASKPFFSFVLKARKILKKLKRLTGIKKNLFLNTLVSFIGEFLDIFDKYIKYKIGMAWADAGYGITIFERYPTDRIRGEFPNKKNKLLPLEQFFPFPDGMIYLDVIPKDSMKRKKKDNHTLEEMNSKRKNYLSLIRELDEIEIINSSNNLDNKIIKIKNYLFKLYKKKKEYIKNKKKFKRVIWKKNFNRKLFGAKLDRSAKDSFFE